MRITMQNDEILDVLREKFGKETAFSLTFTFIDTAGIACNSMRIIKVDVSGSGKYSIDYQEVKTEKSL